ncbi:hypothetical protein ACGFI9_12150 [Micromonospora sp. NPDC048930]|uniref:hypothetical protein n=1 Tax=Micromonospora sp. NPDC048930 TaxID=3364261 RepID=UPI00371F108B
MHDLIAELEGYRNELDSAERYGDKDRAKAVRGEVARVAKAVNARVDQMLADATTADEELRDLDAANKRAEARRMARALPERLRDAAAGRLAADAQPGSRDTADHAPAETATPDGPGEPDGEADADTADRTPTETATPGQPGTSRGGRPASARSSS